MTRGRVVVLTGGVGGAKLVLGLTHIVPPKDVTAIVNVGDDFRHWGLHVSPDADTLLYTLAGRADPTQGWGRADESWQALETVTELGGEGWFRIGDRDLALHVLRTARLAAGEPLSAVLAGLTAAWNVVTRILPATDDPLATWIESGEERFAFQDYFVRRQAAPAVHAVTFRGASTARPAPGVLEAIGDRETRAILIAPSNPFLSVDPILSVPGIKDELIAATAPIVAVSPIVGGTAVKGPTAKIMTELGLSVTPRAIADHYAGVINGLLVDIRDPRTEFSLPTALADTLMHDVADKRRVAAAALALADRLRI